MFHSSTSKCLIACFSVLWLAGMSSVGLAQTRLEDAPINYLETKGQNPVAELIANVESGRTELTYEPGYGYLRSFLKALDVPVSSQALVFSKTSLQSGRISPKNPRAIYFNDDVYVGWVRGSSLLEVSTSDPNLGAVFYSFQMSPRRLFSRRENYRCLGCHETTAKHGKLPMHTIRSVAARDSGKINLLLQDYVTDHTSPIEERWGGWYVTGDHGQTKHMGNSFLEDEELVSFGPSNADTLRSKFDLASWPSPSSDIVALMVMEHQTEMQNRLTDANYAVRRAKQAAAESDESSGDDLETVIDRSAKRVVDHLLFSDEAAIDSPIRCSNSFVDDFEAKGPRTSSGKSLRDFDLQRRLFRYPCSYLIYSDAFSKLDQDLRQRVLERLHDVLVSEQGDDDYSHLSSKDRAALLEILTETLNGLPDSWSKT